MGLLTPPVRSLAVIGLVATGPRKKEENQEMGTERRPTPAEIRQALDFTLFHEIFRDSQDDAYEEIRKYFQGPVREVFLLALNRSVRHKGEVATFDEDEGLIIKKGKG